MIPGLNGCETWRELERYEEHLREDMSEAEFWYLAERMMAEYPIWIGLPQ